MGEKPQSALETLPPQENELAVSPELEEKRIGKTRDYLHEIGFLQEGERGEHVVVLDKFKDIDREELENRLRFYDSERGKNIKFYTQESLVATFDNFPVLSQEEYEQSLEGNREAPSRSLFYTPTDPDKSFDREEIKKSNFYLTLGDLTKPRWSVLDRYYEKHYGCSAQEAELAVHIFHPRFGNGERDEQGRLMVVEPNTQKRVGLSADWIRHNVMTTRRKEVSKEQKHQHLWDSPREALLTPEYSHIRKSGLLSVDDFKQQEGYGRAELLNRRESVIGNRGSIYVDGARYTLGSEYEGKTLTKLAPGFYGIVDTIGGVERVTHSFEPLSQEEIEVRRGQELARVERGDIKGQKSAGALVVVRKGEVKIKALKVSEQNPKRPDESSEEYAERLKTIEVDNYSLLKRLSTDLTKEAGIGIHNLSFREQEWLSSYVYTLKDRYGKVLLFAKQFGLSGLRAFLACEYNAHNGDKVIELPERYPQTKSKELFAAFGTLVDRAGSTRELIKGIDLKSVISEQLTRRLPQQVEEAVLRRAADLLFSFTQRENGEESEVDIDTLTDAMHGFNKALDVIAALRNEEASPYRVDPKPLPQGAGEGQYRFLCTDTRDGMEYGLKVLVRPQAEKHAEARINFEIDFDTESPNEEFKKAFHQETTYYRDDPNKPKTKSESILRLAIDRDTAGEKPKLSFDVGRAQFLGTGYKRTGDILGNLLAEYSASGHHTTESFMSEYAEAEVFAQIAEAFDRHVAHQYHRS